MTVPAEAVEAAAQAVPFVNRDALRRALETAAPHMTPPAITVPAELVVLARLLRDLASWFDADDHFKTTMFPETWPQRGHELQDDLRAWADLLDAP